MAKSLATLAAGVVLVASACQSGPSVASPTTSPSPGPTEAATPAGPPPGQVSSPPVQSPIAGSGVAGTWDGTWINSPDFGTPQASGTFSVTFTQKGNTISGFNTVSGETCVRGGASSGTINGNQIQFGFLADPQRPVQFEGTVTGDTMSGTWNALACPPVNIPIYGTWSATRVATPSASP
jgi:hypothetical protein